MENAGFAHEFVCKSPRHKQRIKGFFHAVSYPVKVTGALSDGLFSGGFDVPLFLRSMCAAVSHWASFGGSLR